MATDDLTTVPFWCAADDEAIDRLMNRFDNPLLTRTDWDAIEDEIARARKEGATEAAATIEALRSELADMKETAMPFVALWATTYAAPDLPKGALYPQHYDLLANLGARMDDFTRWEDHP